MYRHLATLALSVAAASLVACGGTADPTPPAENNAPIANAGADQSVPRGTVVTFDGSASADADGDTLSFVWTLVEKPEGSAALLAGADTQAPTFTADKVGAYVVSLVVSDGTADSAPDTVTVTATNTAPVANAGADQSVPRGTVVTLDGAASADADDDTLTFAWTLAEKPDGSTAELAGADTQAPTFTADKVGAYVVSLVVSDGTADSAPDTVTVTATNIAPVANAGSDRHVSVRTRIGLNGSGTDADGDALTYAWTFASVPAASALTSADIEAPESATAGFTPDVNGTYVLQLVVDDGTEPSVADTVEITATDFLVLTTGLTVNLVRMDGDTVTTVASASIPPEALQDDHAIFGVIPHPVKPWLYVTSFKADWGDARIDRFTLTADGIVYDGLAFAYNAATHPSAALAECASAHNDTEGVVGRCAPVNGVATRDGTRLILKEDDRDNFNVFEVDAETGALELKWVGANSDLHGMAVHPTLPYVYNGVRTFELSEDNELTRLGGGGGGGGNDTTLVSPNLLMSTVETDGVALYSLEDPAAPVELVSLEIGENLARSVAMNRSLDRIVAVGRNTVTTIGFDGETLTSEATLTHDDRDEEDVKVRRENRAVALVNDDSHALVAWFYKPQGGSDRFNGGYAVFSIAPDGALEEVSKVDLGYASRAIVRVEMK